VYRHGLGADCRYVGCLFVDLHPVLASGIVFLTLEDHEIPVSSFNESFIVLGPSVHSPKRDPMCCYILNVGVTALPS
jgi:hypothetical protein